ncbi:MAG TPA: flavodoxin domain-containing protein [Candidatus Ozemobacteraceae bacterium]|nr:flavodoxin domain-containing protein [Candidatus Ozemobacteraceae bacterium]
MTIIRPDIHWVGAIEWALEHFHGHELSIRKGSSYNAYLIRDEKTVLIDTVKYTHAGEFVASIEKQVPIDKIDYIIVNHAEPDHGSALPLILAKNPNATVICSKGGEMSIKRFYPGKWNLKVVKTGDSLSIGKRTLRFFEAQMLHWPDSMFTYCPEEKILFSNDAFGQHYAHSSRYADETDQCSLWQEAEKYFANILTPYSGQITRKVNEFLALNWPIEMICPAHGLIWRKDPVQIVKKYMEWASGNCEKSAVVLYDSIWKNTEKMAHAVCEGLAEEGVAYRLHSAGTTDFNDVMTDILRAKALVVGSPTLNNGLMPTIMPHLEMIRGLRFQKKLCAAFGTFGWSGEAVKRIEEILGGSGFTVAVPAVRAQFAPHEAELEACRNLGRELARKIKAA